MAYEIKEMSMEDLEEILYSVDDQNDRDFRTFKRSLHEMYGGVNIPIYNFLFEHLRSMGIDNDSDLCQMTDSEKTMIIQYLSEMAG